MMDFQELFVLLRCKHFFALIAHQFLRVGRKNEYQNFPCLLVENIVYGDLIHLPVHLHKPPICRFPPISPCGETSRHSASVLFPLHRPLIH